MIIINADDWGGWKSATDAAHDCYVNERISSATAMVFMEDSDRAADLAKERGIDVGLHLNFTTPFSDPKCPRRLLQEQSRTSRFLRRSRYALVLYNPLLRRAFRSLYKAQAEEFWRLYGRSPSHIDGHQHMHLCSNMLLGRIIPAGEKVRRSFSFWPGEKSWVNRQYRKLVDRSLAQRYYLTDYFFSLDQCLRETRLMRVIALAETANVELMTHPERPRERDFLMGDEFVQITKKVRAVTYAQLPPCKDSKVPGLLDRDPNTCGRRRVSNQAGTGFWEQR